MGNTLTHISITLKSKKEYLKLIKIILFFVNQESLYLTKLNKLLFYFQLEYFKNYNKTYFQFDFINTKQGPVFKDGEFLISYLDTKNFINLEDNDFGWRITPKKIVAKKDYTKPELIILNMVYRKFKKYSSRKLMKYTQNEDLCKKTPYNQTIIFK